LNLKKENISSILFFFSLEYANNLGSTKKTNGVDHTTTDGTSNGNTEDSHKQYLLDLLEKF